jgi:hypothetical protein
MAVRAFSSIRRWLLLALLPWLLAAACLAGEKAAPKQEKPAQKKAQTAPRQNEWSGWWFLYHRDDGGKLVLDKFTVAVVVDDVVWPGFAPVTGMWTGCVWGGLINRVRYGKNSVALTYTPPGERTVTFTLTRTGPDEAEGVFSDEPKVKYVARREREHGACAGYDP